MSEHKNTVYRNISAELLKKIENGTFPVGSKLPPERQLMTEYGVERLTVRRALDVLAAEGKIVKKSGLGSFVTGSDAAEKHTKNKMSGAAKPQVPEMNDTEKVLLSTVCTVRPDLSAAAQQIYTSLTKLRHEKIVFISSHSDIFAAFSGVMATHTKIEPSDFLLTDAEIQAGSAFERYQRSLRGTYPTAVITGTVKEAEEIEKCASALRIAVPDKMSVFALLSDGKRYTGCLFDTTAVQLFLSGAWSGAGNHIPEFSVTVPPVFFEGSTAAPKNEDTRGHGMSDYLL